MLWQIGLFAQLAKRLASSPRLIAALSALFILQYFFCFDVGVPLSQARFGPEREECGVLNRTCSVDFARNL